MLTWHFPDGGDYPDFIAKLVIVSLIERLNIIFDMYGEILRIQLNDVWRGVFYYAILHT